MKKSSINYLLIILLFCCVALSCTKQSEILPASANENSVTDASESSISNCTICDPSTKSYDLLKTIQVFNFKDGNNIISDLGNGTKAIAQISNGHVTNWILKNKIEKPYLAKSIEKVNQQFLRQGKYFPVYRYCFYIDGWWFCLIVIRF